MLANDPGFDPTVKNHGLSTPLERVVSRDGRKRYIAAFGSSKVGVFDNPVTASPNYIAVSGGGPSGLALDESRKRLYVMTRFENAVKVIVAMVIGPRKQPMRRQSIQAGKSTSLLTTVSMRRRGGS